jgi:hypothetical protein
MFVKVSTVSPVSGTEIANQGLNRVENNNTKDRRNICKQDAFLKIILKRKEKTKLLKRTEHFLLPYVTFKFCFPLTASFPIFLILSATMASLGSILGHLHCLRALNCSGSDESRQLFLNRTHTQTNDWLIMWLPTNLNKQNKGLLPWKRGQWKLRREPELNRKYGPLHGLNSLWSSEEMLKDWCGTLRNVEYN